ncbi:MAG TPA: MFS transporter, partial [Acidimicrobiales bacterium]|nr:MFS transporter [Acidimicrobiales bacterium]
MKNTVTSSSDMPASMPASYGPPMRRDSYRFALLCGSTLLNFVALGILLAVLPQFLRDELHTTRAVVGLSVGSYSFSAVLARPWLGRKLDMLGRRWFLFGAPIGLGLTSLVLLTVHSVLAIVVLRLIQGVVGSTFYTAAATVATDLAPLERRGEYISRFSLFLYGGFAIGPSVATAVIARGGFAWTWTVGIACVVVSSAIAFALPETQPANEAEAPIPRFRLVHPAAVGPGMVLITAAVGYTAISVFAPLYAERIGMSSSGPLYLAFALTV